MLKFVMDNSTVKIEVMKVIAQLNAQILNINVPVAHNVLKINISAMVTLTVPMHQTKATVNAVITNFGAITVGVF